MIVFTRIELSEIFGSNHRLHQQILAHQAHLFEELSSLQGVARDKAIRVLSGNFGNSEIADDYLRALERRLNSVKQITTRQRASITRLLKGEEIISISLRGGRTANARGVILGSDEDVVETLKSLRLSGIFQSDHLVEQRFIDALKTGDVGFAPANRFTLEARRNVNRIKDTYAIAVPNNELVYYEIVRVMRDEFPDLRRAAFDLPGLYPHVGPASKTSMMKKYIKDGSEPWYTVGQHYQTHRWVIKKHMGIDSDIIDDMIAEDIAHAVVEGKDHGRALESELRRQFGTYPNDNILVDRIKTYLLSLDSPGEEYFNPKNFPSY